MDRLSKDRLEYESEILALRAEVESAKDTIKALRSEGVLEEYIKENKKLSRKIEQLRGDIVLTAEEHDKTIDDLAAAVEVLRRYKEAIDSLPLSLIGRIEMRDAFRSVYAAADTLLARLEVKP